MRKLLPLLFFIASAPLFAQNDALQGLCSLGGTKALVSGLSSTNYNNGIVPGCSVEVFLTGTTTHAAIFSNVGGTPLSNPFTAVLAGSPNPGYWIFYAATGVGYDVKLSGGGGNPACTTAPNCYTIPLTYTDLKVGGGGGGSGVTSFSSGNLPPLFTTNVTNPATTPNLGFTLTNAASTTLFGNFTNSTGPPFYATYSCTGLLNCSFDSGSNTLTLNVPNTSLLSITTTDPVKVNGGNGPVGSGTANISCPSCGQTALDMNVIPPVAGQHAVIYPTVGILDSDPGNFSNINPNGGYFQYGCSGLFCGIAPYLTAHWNFGSLPGYITPSSVTSIYFFAISSSTYFLNDFSNNNSISCTLNGGTVQLAAWGGGGAQPYLYGPLQINQLSGGAGTDWASSPPVCNVRIGPGPGGLSASTGTIFNIPAIGAIVYYTGTAPPLSTALNIAPPLTYNAGTNVLGLDESNLYTYSIYASTVDALPPAPSMPKYTLRLVNNSYDCVNPGSSTTLCEDTGSAWAPLVSSGVGDTITSPGGTLTVGGTSTATTLDIALAHANTWTGAQTFNWDTYFNGEMHIGTGMSFEGGIAAIKINGNFGTTGQCLESQGTGNTPAWGTCGGGSVGPGTVGYLPLFNTTTSIANSHIDDGATTFGTITSSEPIAVSSGSGQGGTFNATEGTAATAAAGHDILYADSTNHCLEYSANGGSFSCLGTGSSGVSQIVAGTNVTISPSGGTGVVTVNSTGGGSPLDVFPVTSYGCVGDGNLPANTGTDNLTCFNSAIAAAAANTGGLIQLQCGKQYLVSGTITVTSSHIRFITDCIDQQYGSTVNHAGSIVFLNSASGTVLDIHGTSGTWVSYNGSDNVAWARSVFPPAAGSKTISLNYAGGFVFQRGFADDSQYDVYMNGVAAWGTGKIENFRTDHGCVSSYSPTIPYYGFYLDGSTQPNPSPRFAWIFHDNCLASGTTVYGWKTEGPHTSDLNVDHLETSNDAIGITVDGADGAGAFSGTDQHFTNSVLDGNAVSAVLLENLPYGADSAIEVTHSWLNCLTTTNCVDLESVFGANVSDNQIYATETGVTALLYAHNSSHLIVDNNHFYFGFVHPYSGTSIIADGTDLSSFSHNVMDSSSSSNTEMILRNSTVNNTVEGNTIGGSAAVGISVDATSNNNRYVNFNACGSSVTSCLSDLGTGNQFTGTTVSVNGTAVPNPNFNGTTPSVAATTGVNNVYQASAPSVSSYTPVATASVPGVVKPDGSTCTVTSGVLTCTGSSGGTSIAICAPSSASGTAYTCTTSPSFTPAAGSVVLFKPDVSNSGTSATLNVNSSSAAPLAKWQNTTTIATNDFRAGTYTVLSYDGTNWEAQTIGNPPSAGSGNYANLCNSVTLTGATCSGGVITPSGSSTTITIASIPGTYNRWDLGINGRSTNSGTGGENVYVQMNSDTGTNYTYTDTAVYASSGPTAERGTGVAPTSTQPCVLISSGSSRTGDCIMSMRNYAGTTNQKTFKYNYSWPDGSNSDTRQGSEDWLSTAAVTQIVLTLQAGNFTTDTQITLYGTN